MEKFKEFWEDPTKRKLVMIFVMVPLLYFILSAVGDDKEQRKRAPKVAQDEQIQVFSTDGVDQLDKYQIEQMKEDLVRQAEVENKAIAKERKAMEKQNAELSKQLVRQQKELSELKKMFGTFVKSGGQVQQPNNQGQPVQGNATTQINQQQRPVAQQQYGMPNAYNRNQTTILTRTPVALEGNAIRTVTQRQIRSVKSTGDIAVEQRKNSVLSQKAERAAANSLKLKEQETIQAMEFFLPAGSIMSGTLLNGVDAPTSSATVNDPMPILLRIKKEAILPNHYTMDVRECHMLASAVGELSSERVRMRAEAISCVLNDGRAIEKNITAYAVSSYDGKVGIRGRLVSRNGSAIARALMAGFVSGLADAVSPLKIL